MVHSEEMLTKCSEKHLGDILTNDGKPEENLKYRQTKGFGISNQILSLLKQISFEKFYFQMAILVRSSLLINGTLFNVEALHGIKNKHLESVKGLMRKIFDCPQGTPLEAFFIETSTLPIRFILMGRRLMYFWTVLNKPETELVRQVLEAQKIFKTDGCWVETVEDDLKACEAAFQAKNFYGAAESKL